MFALCWSRRERERSLSRRYQINRVPYHFHAWGLLCWTYEPFVRVLEPMADYTNLLCLAN